MSSVRAVAQAHFEAVRCGDPSAMAADYHDDAVILRGRERYVGRDQITAYFATLPGRLADGRVEVAIEEVDADTVTSRWTIRGGPGDGTSGRDVLTIAGGVITHQVVHLEADDF